jgi:hypothetical protein
MMRSSLAWSLAFTLFAAPAAAKQFVIPHTGWSTPAPPHLTSAIAARAFVDDGVPPSLNEALPSNIVAPDVVRGVAAAMLRASPTFRRQCARLASAPDLIVTVYNTQMPGSRPYVASTRIYRRADGRLAADVHIAPGGDREELLAHEFEHIIEQLDGIDLVALAKRPGTGVHVVPNASEFETDRAVTIGRQVASEMRAMHGS